MQEAINRAIRHAYPELSGGLHVDRYARVVAIADQPTSGATCERFRPRYAVDIEILTPELEADNAFPRYTAVPLPVPCGMGHEAGMFAFPDVGALVVVGFAYGRPDHPIIRQVYPMGASLPAVAPQEWLVQQSPTVFQRADKDGNWTRQSDATITDDSLSRVINAIDATTSLARELREISEHATTKVGGVATLEAGAVINLLAGLRVDVGTLGSLNLTAGAAGTLTTGTGLTELVGQHHVITVKGNQTEAISGQRVATIGQDDSLNVGGNLSHEVTGNSAETVAGSKNITAANIALTAQGKITCKGGGGAHGGTSLFAELLAALDAIIAALETLAAHTHPNVGVIAQGASVAASAADAQGHRDIIAGITG